MNNTLHQFYTDKVAALTTEIAELKCHNTHNTTFVLAELAAFVAMLASLVAYTLTSIGVLFIILAVISFAVYYFIRQVDAGKNYKADECERLLKLLLLRCRREVYRPATPVYVRHGYIRC